MEYIVAGNTDIGNVKNVNQDSFCVMKLKTKLGRMVFAIVCDGMGGLSGGEVASASVVTAFREWVQERLPELCEGNELEDSAVRTEWSLIIDKFNVLLEKYGKENYIKPGTTVAALLLSESRYYIINVGDSRIYELGNQIIRLTEDQTVAAREVKEGRLTPQEAEKDDRSSILLQGIGVTRNIYPQMLFGVPKLNAVYMLCSDGFRHEISADEIYSYLRAERMTGETEMKNNIDSLISIVKQRGEEDNITCIAIRTC